MRIHRLILVSALLASTAAAFTDPLAGKHIAWGKLSTVATSPGVFGKALAVDFAATGNAQIAVLRDDKLIYMWTPYAHGSASLIGGGINDFCLIPSHDFNPGQGIVSVGSLGVYVHFLNSTGTSFVNTVVDGSTGALGATKVGWGDLNGDGKGDLVIVLADGLTMRTYYNAGGSAYTVGDEITISQPVRDIWIAKWGTSLVPRVIVHSGSGIGVYLPNLTGESSLRTQAPGPTLDAASLFTLPDGEQGVGWATWLNPGVESEQKFLTYRQSGATNFSKIGPVSENPFEPGVVSLAMGDATADGFPELVFGATGTKQLLYSRNLARSSGSPLSFNVSNSGIALTTVSSGSGSAPTNRAHPVLNDFNRDGVMDLFAPVQDVLGVTTLVGPLDTQGANFHSLTGTLPISSAAYAFSGGGSAIMPPASHLRLVIDPAAWPGDHSTATHLRMVMWRWPFPTCSSPTTPDHCTAANEPLVPTAIANYYYSLTNGVVPNNALIEVNMESALTGTYDAACIELSLVRATFQPGGGVRVSDAWTLYPYVWAREFNVYPMDLGPIARAKALPNADIANEIDFEATSAAPNVQIIIPAGSFEPFPTNSTPALPAYSLRGFATYP